MVIDLPGRTEPFQLHEFGNRGPSPGQCLDQAQPHGVPQSSERVGRLGPVRTQHRTRYVFGTWLRRGAPHSLLKLGEPPRNLGDLPDQRVPWRRRITHSASLSSDAREWTSPTEVNLRSIRPGSATASNSVWKQVISPVFSPTSSWDRTKPHVLQADEQVDFAAPHRLFPSADSPPTARSGAASSMRAGSRQPADRRLRPPQRFRIRLHAELFQHLSVVRPRSTHRPPATCASQLRGHLSRLLSAWHRRPAKSVLLERSCLALSVLQGSTQVMWRRPWPEVLTPGLGHARHWVPRI